MNGWKIATTIYMSLMIISVVYGQGKPRPNMGFMVFFMRIILAIFIAGSWGWFS